MILNEFNWNEWLRCEGGLYWRHALCIVTRPNKAVRCVHQPRLSCMRVNSWVVSPARQVWMTPTPRNKFCEHHIHS